MKRQPGRYHNITELGMAEEEQGMPKQHCVLLQAAEGASVGCQGILHALCELPIAL